MLHDFLLGGCKVFTDFSRWKWNMAEKRKFASENIFTFLPIFSVMAESQVRSPSDANLDFDDATLKGKNILI